MITVAFAGLTTTEHDGLVMLPKLLLTTTLYKPAFEN